MTKRLLDHTTCMKEVACDAATLLIDASEYFRAFYLRAMAAQRAIYIAGWQFNSQVELVRGAEAERSQYPTRFLPFLTALCRERPHLIVNILAWDYHPVFALEREWLQEFVFEIGTPDNLRFQFDDHHAPGASLHQKMVVIDGVVAYVGGIDLACGRWDDCSHCIDNPLRLEGGEPQKPYHDTMVELTGEVAREIEGIFSKRWQEATGEASPPAAEQGITPEKIDGHGVAIRTRRVGICRTEHRGGDSEEILEVKALYERAIWEAKQLVYFETQYLTSRAILDAFFERVRDASKPPLQLVVVMPNSADSAKESLALGAAQEEVLMGLAEGAERYGSTFRVYMSLAKGGERSEVTTFIHSKILIVDDRLLCVGSANLTNRSLQLDSEICVAFESRDENDALAESIAAVRATLLGEHCGVRPELSFFRPDGLVGRLDALAANPEYRLRTRPINRELASRDRVLKLERLFDPDKPLDEMELREVLALEF